MTLKIKGKGSESFYKEIISITSQYYRLIKKPEAELQDVFEHAKRMFIGYLFFLAILILKVILNRAAVWRSALMGFMISIVIFMSVSFYLALRSYNRKLKERLDDEPEEYDFILDDEGVEMKSISMTIRQSWDSMAFVRIFNEAICFVPKKSTHAMLFASRSVYDEIKPYIKCFIYGDNDVRPDR